MAQRFIERTKEPWFGHDSIFAYVHVMILKEAVERAAVADRHKVAEAIRKLDMTDGPALFFPDGHLKYDEKGRRVGAKLCIVQWQKGRPTPVLSCLDRRGRRHSGRRPRDGRSAALRTVRDPLRAQRQREAVGRVHRRRSA